MAASGLWARDLHKAGLLAALPALAALVVVLPPWLADWNALAQPGGPQGLLKALGIFAGVAGCGLWVASLLLVLRFPLVDRYFGGLEQQYFAHHLTGTIAYLLLLAHGALLAVSAAYLSPAAGTALAQPWSRPFSVMAGWIALLGLMFMMFATFFSNLPYQLWRRLHAASGVAFLLAIGHVAWLTPPAGSGRAGALLLLLLMGVGLLALGLRHWLARGSLAALAYEVKDVTRVSPTTVEVTLAPGPGTPPLAFAAGQFVYVAFDASPGYAGCREYHPFTISSVADWTNFRVLIKALGDCTTRIQQLKRGVRARVQGPYGALFRGADFSRRQIWLAGGIGVTPFLAMAEALPDTAAGVDFYYLARSAGDAPGLDAVRAAAAANPALRVFAFLDNEAAPVVRDAMLRESAPLREREVYVCGPPAMLQQWLKILNDASVPEAHVHAERFDFR